MHETPLPPQAPREPLTAGDTAQALLLEDLRPQSVQRCRTGATERRGDGLVVSARQRCFDGYLQPDGVGDLGGGVRMTITFENIREEAGNGRPQSHPAMRIVQTLPD